MNVENMQIFNLSNVLTGTKELLWVVQITALAYETI